MFLSGKSVKALAAHFSTSRTVINLRLRKMGVSARNRSEAQRVKLAQMSLTERRAVTAAANSAWRGQKLSYADKLRRARTKEKFPKIYPLESRLMKLLQEQGISGIIPQKAIGMYNCDIAATPVAVEVWSKSFPPSRAAQARQSTKRIKKFLRKGWHVVVVTDRPVPIGKGAAAYLTAYIQRMRGKPSAPREYRMISGTGKLLASDSLESHKLSVEYPFGAGRNSRGQYCSVPK